MHRERWRRWNHFLCRRGVTPVPFDPPVTPGRVPDAFLQQTFSDGGIEPYIRFFAALRFG